VSGPLVAGIHVLVAADQRQNADGRDKPGHDACWKYSTPSQNALAYCWHNDANIND
jgi:hypothetical protein